VEADRGNDGLWKARKTIRPFSALPTNLGNRKNRFPHSHRRGGDEQNMKSSRKGAAKAARLKLAVQAHFWIGKDFDVQMPPRLTGQLHEAGEPRRTGDLKGNGFSRAGHDAENATALAAEGCLSTIQNHPSGAEALGSSCRVCGTTKEAAEKPRKTGESPEKHPAGAEAHSLLSTSCGTTEVVPCYKARPIRSFSAASKAVPFQSPFSCARNVQAIAPGRLTATSLNAQRSIPRPSGSPIPG